MENIFEKSNDISNTSKCKNLATIIFNDILHERKTTSKIKLFQKLLGQSGLNTEDLYNYVESNKNFIIENIGSKDCSFNTKIFTIFSLFRNTLGKITYAGCYEIRNNQTNEVYIGESIDLFRRFTKHISDLYENKHHCVKLQEAFNITRTMDNFVIKPIKVNSIVCADKTKVKEETLYMESAYYLMYKKDGYTLYNTINPYEALKNDEVYVGNNKVNCKNVLFLLCEDRYNILDKIMLNFILNDLKDIIDINDILSNTPPKANNYDQIEIQNSIKEINLLKGQGWQFYTLSGIYKDMSEQNIIPQKYDTSKLREVLAKNNLIEFKDDNGIKRTFATDYALNKKFLFAKEQRREKSGFISYRYLVSENGKNFIFNIFSNYPNKDELEYKKLDETA